MPTHPRAASVPSIVLTGWLAVAAAGCAVLEMSVERPLPSAHGVLVGIQDAQRGLADWRTHAEKNLQAGAAAQPVAAHGATQAAYQRWVDDEVRELPEPSRTVAIVGGEN